MCDTGNISLLCPHDSDLHTRVNSVFIGQQEHLLSARWGALYRVRNSVSNINHLFPNHVITRNRHIS
jgi:hypothetical protein